MEEIQKGQKGRKLFKTPNTPSISLFDLLRTFMAPRSCSAFDSCWQAPESVAWHDLSELENAELLRDLNRRKRRGEMT